MLEITRKTLTLDPQEVMELERIVTDDDQADGFIQPHKTPDSCLEM